MTTGIQQKTIAKPFHKTLLQINNSDPKRDLNANFPLHCYTLNLVHFM